MSFGEKDIKLRDFVLAVCSLLNLIEGECDEALKLFGFGILNREDERDSAIIKYLNNEKQTELKFEDKLKDFCEYLARNGFEALKIREREKKPGNNSKITIVANIVCNHDNTDYSISNGSRMIGREDCTYIEEELTKESIERTVENHYNTIGFVEKPKSEIAIQHNTWTILKNDIITYLNSDGYCLGFCVFFFMVICKLMSYFLDIEIMSDSFSMGLSFCCFIIFSGLICWGESNIKMNRIRLFMVALAMLYFCLLRSVAVFCDVDLFARYFLAFVLIVFVNASAAYLAYMAADIQLTDGKGKYISIIHNCMRRFCFCCAGVSSLIAIGGAVYCAIVIGYFGSWEVLTNY